MPDQPFTFPIYVRVALPNFSERFSLYHCGESAMSAPGALDVKWQFSMGGAAVAVNTLCLR